VKPVIVSRIGGIPELVKDYLTGLTFESGNHNDLQEKMAFFENNSEKRVNMGKNARKVVEENLNSEYILKKLVSIYERVINRSKSIKHQKADIPDPAQFK
jgi:glycosyltransferase involved in cell wall biosynthesis